MKTNKLYKYINLLFRIIIGVAAVWFIYIKLKDNFILNLQHANIEDVNYALIVLAVLMVFINWGIEAVKWRYAIRKVEKISFLKAFKITITGITLGLITPNRIGEIPARALLLDKNLFKENTLKISVSSFSQVLITLLLGGFGFLLTQDKFNIEIDSVLINLILFLLVFGLLLFYFMVNKMEVVFNKIKYFRDKAFFNALSEFSFIELLNMLIFSFLRYVVFSLQFWLVLKAFGISFVTINDLLLIPVCFMFASMIPTILISEIGVRGSVALFVFGTISDMEIQIILASVLLWLINVALPALAGLGNLKSFKILKER